MAVINKQELLSTLKEGLKLQSSDPSSYLEKMLTYTTIEMSKKFSSLFHNELTLDSDDDGILTLPSDTFLITSIQYNTVEIIPLYLRQNNIYRNLALVTNGNLWGAVKQYKDRVEVKITPGQAYTDVYVLLQNLNGGVGNIPAEYEEVLFWGTRWRYLASKRGEVDEKLLASAKATYRGFLDQMTMEQNKMYPPMRMQQYWERAWEQNLSLYPADQTADVYSAI